MGARIAIVTFTANQAVDQQITIPLGIGLHAAGLAVSHLQSMATAPKHLPTSLHLVQIPVVLFLGLDLFIVPHFLQVQDTMHLFFQVLSEGRIICFTLVVWVKKLD